MKRKSLKPMYQKEYVNYTSASTSRENPLLLQRGAQGLGDEILLCQCGRGPQPESNCLILAINFLRKFMVIDTSVVTLVDDYKSEKHSKSVFRSLPPDIAGSMEAFRWPFQLQCIPRSIYQLSYSCYKKANGRIRSFLKNHSDLPNHEAGRFFEETAKYFPIF